MEEKTPAAVDHFASAQVIQTRERELPGTPHHVLRERLLRTDMKYPLIRVEEELRVEDGKSILIRQLGAVGDHVIVEPLPGVTEEAFLAALQHLGAQVRAKKPASGIWIVAFPNADLDTVPQAIAEISKVASIAKNVEPDFIVHATLTPNDSSYTSLWGLHNTGQNGGTADADIDAPEAWDLSTGSRNVLVGVIDTGIDATHPDLTANMWTNPKEIAGNGIDDDHNGYVDDTRGWDFVNEDNNPADDQYHGTHCAGTIGGVGNNGTGVVGVNWQVSLVGLKFLNASGSGTTSDAIEATAYGTGIGVDLTSNSWGGGGFSQSLKNAIDAAGAKDILFVAAAGNDAANSDAYPSYPSSYISANIISVASTTRYDGLSSFSNYGATSVDLAAPGSEIYSTVPDGAYSLLNGTSMATPHVSGVCALLRAYQPGITAARMKEVLLQSVDPLPNLSGRCVSGGRLNAGKALLLASDLVLTPGTDLALSGEEGKLPSLRKITYTLTNLSSDATEWTASADRPWITLSASGGTLAGGASTTLTVTLTSAVDALAVGSYSGTVTVNNLTKHRIQTRLVTVEVLAPVVRSALMDADPAWALEGPWAYGAPTGGGGYYTGGPDPSSGATGSQVVGVNLSGDQSAIGGPWYATTGPYDLSYEDGIQVEYQRWLNVASRGYATATFEVSTNNVSWTTLWSNSSAITDAAWSRQNFDVAAIASRQQKVWFRWGYQMTYASPNTIASGWNIDDFKIRGRKINFLTFTLPESMKEGDAAAPILVTASPPPAGDLKVTFTASNAEATVPAEGVIWAGQNSVIMPVTPENDTWADGSQKVMITASAANYRSCIGPLTIHDDETRTLAIEAPSSLAENAGAITTGKVTLNTTADRGVTVTLVSSAPDILQVPASVTIPGNAKEVALPITVLNNASVDDSRAVTITASVVNWTDGSKTITVTDDEPHTLTLAVPATVSEGAGQLTGTVSLAGITSTAVAVTLTSSHGTEISSGTCTIPAGASSASFTLPVLDDAVQDGEKIVTLTATAATFTQQQATVKVGDDEIHHYAFSTIASPQKEGKSFDLTLMAKDLNGATILVPPPGAISLTATGNTGAVPLDPATLESLPGGTWQGGMRVMAAGDNIRITATGPATSSASNAFHVSIGARLAVNPTSLTVSIPQGLTATRPLTLSNTGSEPLTWAIAPSYPVAVDPGDIIMNTTGAHEKSAAENAADPSASATKPMLLDDVRTELNTRFAEITALIPNRFDFIEGVTGNFIADGGNDMFDNGNSLQFDGSTSYLDYSENVILPSTLLGTGGQYFTRKFPGLFVMVADIADRSSFSIVGNLGADGTGTVNGAVLTASRGGRTYKGFVKRVYGSSDPSVQHLIIVEDNGTASHSYSASTDNDQHTVSSLTGVTRIYHLLYSSQNGTLIDDERTAEIFAKFLDVAGARDWLSAKATSGTLAPGASTTVQATLSAVNMARGTYQARLDISSNDQRQPLGKVPVTMIVTAPVHHFTWDAIPASQIVNTPFTATVRAQDAAGNTIASFNGQADLSLLASATAGETRSGTATTTSSDPLGLYYPVSRSQAIYLPAEVGPAGRLTGLALDISNLGTPSAGTYTIRLKHTTHNDYSSSAAFEADGWTTVFSGPKTLTAGLNYYTFSSPFDYDGHSRLLVDISYTGSTNYYFTTTRCVTPAVSRSIFASAYSGDPLSWGTGSSYSKTNYLAVLRFVNSGMPGFVRPAATGTFTNGVWTGDVAVGSLGPVKLIASAASATGMSNSFTTTATGSLALSLPTALTEGQGTLLHGGTITVSPPAATALVVQLENLAPERITLPATITIPAGQSSSDFDLSVPDNSDLEGSVTIASRASAPGYVTAQATSVITENDTVALTLTAVASITEGNLASQATVALSRPAAADLTFSLSASTPTGLVIPATVLVRAGKSSASFTIAYPENNLIEDATDIILTATFPGSPPATATIRRLDNEGRNLKFYYTEVTEGAATTSSTLYLNGTLTQPLTITFTSSDPAQLLAPPPLTIPAGSSQGTFTLTAVNDTLYDGTKTVTLTASASGFISYNGIVYVHDNDVHHFILSSIASPQISGKAFPVNIQPVDINGRSIYTYAGTPTFTVTQGDATLPTTPASASVSGSSTSIPITVGALANSAVLKVTDPLSGNTSTSNAFAIGTAPLHHFTWGAIASPRVPFSPFTTTVSARDGYENTLGFTGTASLALVRNYQETTIGSAQTYDWMPFGGYYPQTRSQIIYLKSEVGATARRIHAISFLAQGPSSSYPALELTNLLVRMKHTNKSDFLGANGTWETTGWTEVHRGSRIMNDQAGWRTILLTTPFDYDGTSNLMVDISSNRTSMGNRVESGNSYSTGSRLFYATTSGQAAPEQWTGTPGYAYSYLPDCRFISYQKETITPAQSTAFTSGQWTGSFRLPQTGTGLRLIAWNGDTLGVSSPFDSMIPVPILAAEPAFTGGLANTLAWQPLAATDGVQIERAPTGAFANTTPSQWITATQATITGLTDGAAYHYRARNRLLDSAQPTAEPVYSAWSNIVTSTQDASPPVIATRGMSTGISNLSIQGTATDLSGIASITISPTAPSSVVLTPVDFLSSGYWVTSFSNLPFGTTNCILTVTDNAVPPNIGSFTFPLSRIPDWGGDEDRNGLSGLLEHALGIPPGNLDFARKLPTGNLVKNSVDGKTYLTFQYRRRLFSGGLSYAVETSSDLKTWDTTGSKVQELTSTPTGDGITELVTVRILPAISPAMPKNYTRLNITFVTY